MSDQLSHLWGMPLAEYIQNLKTPRPKERVPSRVEVISALQKVYNQSLSVSCDTFEDNLAVVLYPRELAELAQRFNTLSSSCVKLLREHSTRANGLSNGYLGLRVLVLSLLVTFIGYSNPKSFDYIDHKQGNVGSIMKQLTAAAGSSLTFGYINHAGPPENIWHKSDDSRSLSSLMDWHSNMTDEELDNLLSLLVTERRDFFGVCFLSPDTQGWALLVFVLWVRIAPGCGPGNRPPISSLKRLYQLNDLLGRYCLTATYDPTLTFAYNISRWMAYKLLPDRLIGNPGFKPNSEDMAELPHMKKIAMGRLGIPPTPWEMLNTDEADPTGVDLLTVILEFITGYQRHSTELLDDVYLQMTEAMLARLWEAVQSKRVFAGLLGRFDTYKLAYAVFRNAAFTIS
ncbi:hypothetical protein FRC12_014555 [Ceratobasidium sp. 428]|nr:hypothetical protein FRC12_014555 [Ceratobasidium sp. 428]